MTLFKVTCWLGNRKIYIVAAGTSGKEAMGTIRRGAEMPGCYWHRAIIFGCKHNR